MPRALPRPLRTRTTRRRWSRRRLRRRRRRRRPPPPSPPPPESMPTAPPRPLRNLCLFAIVGFSSSYTFGDLLWANMASFMRCDPAGLDLPDRTAMAGNLATFSVFLLSWLRCRVAARPGFNFYARLVHATIFAVVAAGVVTAFAWRLPFVVPMANGLAASVGALSWAAVIPFTALHFDESLVSALFVGGTIGSLVAGMIGLVQAAAPAFGPLAALLSLAAVQSSAFAAWSLILRKGYGRKPRDRLLGAKPPASDTELSPMPADGGGAVAGAPGDGALRPPRWLRRVADVWVLALAINTTAWGMAPNISRSAPRTPAARATRRTRTSRAPTASQCRSRTARCPSALSSHTWYRRRRCACCCRSPPRSCSPSAYRYGRRRRASDGVLTDGALSSSPPSSRCAFRTPT